MKKIYRRRKNGVVAHWMENCPHWPEENYEETTENGLPQNYHHCSWCLNRELARGEPEPGDRVFRRLTYTDTVHWMENCNHWPVSNYVEYQENNLPANFRRYTYCQRCRSEEEQAMVE